MKLAAGKRRVRSHQVAAIRLTRREERREGRPKGGARGRELRREAQQIRRPSERSRSALEVNGPRQGPMRTEASWISLELHSNDRQLKSERTGMILAECYRGAGRGLNRVAHVVGPLVLVDRRLNISEYRGE